MSLILFVFCSFNPKYKDSTVSRSKEHKVCMMQRTTKDEGASDFNPPFALPYPAPFTKYWYLGPVGQERLRALKDSRAQQQNSDKGSLDGAQADVRAGRERP